MCENHGKKGVLLKAVLLCAAALAGVLALLILVPTSPALLVDDPVTLVRLYTGGVDDWGDPAYLPVTAYAVYIAVGAALAICFTAVLTRSRGRCPLDGVALALVSGACALLCSHLLFCAVRWGYIINDLGGSAAFLLQLWQGGYTMYGAILGGLLGAFLYARAKKWPVAEALDAIAPGMLILVAAGRFGERFTLQGMANYRAAEALQGLPFASLGEWGDPELMVYAYEVIAALAALAVCLWALGCRAPAGRAVENGLALLSAWQIMMESWRGDELIKFGFVCLNMLMAAGVLAVILAQRVIRSVKKQGWKPWSIVRIGLLLVCAGVVIAVEFALDGKIGLPGVSDLMLYGVMTAAVIGMMASVMAADGRTMEGK